MKANMHRRIASQPFNYCLNLLGMGHTLFTFFQLGLLQLRPGPGRAVRASGVFPRAHLFSAEIVPFVQTYIRRNTSHGMDSALDLIRAETRLSEPESWRRAEQAVDKNERKCMREIHEMLASWRSAWESGSGGSGSGSGSYHHAFVDNP
ncbi:hypothetical protein GGR56DRAFT_644432 [Xylariaceae sp. FL0804]|nr:hypothetical protein GGR56DRAFT_644432 [Xylariaceae sp. FL0804]